MVVSHNNNIMPSIIIIIKRSLTIEYADSLELNILKQSS